MNIASITPAAEAEFPATVSALRAGELYPCCPRCNGDREVFAYTSIGNEFAPSRGEYFACPVCDRMGEAEASRALAFIDDWQVEHGHSA